MHTSSSKTHKTYSNPLGCMHMADAADVAQETWQAMEKLVDQGLVRSIGISNFSVKKIKVTYNPHKLHKPLLALQALHAPLHCAQDFLFYLLFSAQTVLLPLVRLCSVIAARLKRVH